MNLENLRMRSLKTFAAIIAALFLGAVAATLLAGCQPAKPTMKASRVTSTTTDASTDTVEPKAEIKDEKPAEPSEEKPAATKEEAKPADEKPAEEKGATDKPAEDKPAEEKPAEEKADSAKPDEKKATTTRPTGSNSPVHNPVIKAGDWNQWGGTSLRNNTPIGQGIVTEWDPGQFDRKTGDWKPATAKKMSNGWLPWAARPMAIPSWRRAKCGSAPITAMAM